LNRVLTLVEHELVGVVATVAMLLATYQLLSRYLYPPASTHWIDEVVIYLIIWASCLSFSGLVAGNAHVRADLVLRMLPQRLQRRVEMVNTLAALALCGLLVWFGGNYYSYDFLNNAVDIFGATIAANRLVALGFAVVIGLGFYLILTRTRMGTALRAVAVDPTSARLVAIDVNFASCFAFALGGAMAAVGGVLVSMFLTFSTSMGVVFTMKALIVVIMGGVGNMLGALIAGLILGVAESLVATYIDPGLTIAVTYVIFLLVLLIKPSGLFGRATS